MSKHMTLKHPDNYQSHYSKGKKIEHSTGSRNEEASCSNVWNWREFLKYSRGLSSPSHFQVVLLIIVTCLIYVTIVINNLIYSP